MQYAQPLIGQSVRYVVLAARDVARFIHGPVIRRLQITNILSWQKPVFIQAVTRIVQR